MKILIGCVFGIGNSVMRIPAIKAIKSLGHEVELLVGSLPDDFGAFNVLRHLGIPINVNMAGHHRFDLAIMSIPFDGRWTNGVHFSANEVWDERRRPENSTLPGFTSWMKHEVEYQMENARRLGYEGETPDMSFLPKFDRSVSQLYLGVGFKKDPRGEAKVRYWGLENYKELLWLLFNDEPNLSVVATGDLIDVKTTLQPLRNEFGMKFSYKSPPNIEDSFAVVNSSRTFIGNDTGMMHVAASCDLSVVSMHFQDGAIRKNPPFCRWRRVLQSLDKSLTPQEVFEAYRSLRDERQG